MLTLQELLNLKSDLLKNSRVKLVRHRDNKKTYHELIRDRAKLIEYQKEQAKPKGIFHNCDYIISFIALERKRCMFIGVFKVNGVEHETDQHYYYNLEQVNEFDYLIDRLIINWGDNPRVWVQLYNKQIKEVVEILPAGYMGHFPGLLQFVLEFHELKRIADNPEANFEWKNHLSAINGIYLILDDRDGKQYIGSAYGEGGIWQRWCNYAKTITGGNKLLQKLYEENQNCHQHFHYSILQTLPSNITGKEVIKIENLYKEKLGSRGVLGLNAN